MTSSISDTWLSSMKRPISPGSSKSTSAAKSDSDWRRVIVARHRGSRDRQQRTAQAVPHTADFGAAGDRRHCIERSHHAKLAVVV
jgi:hypothetical protein